MEGDAGSLGELLDRLLPVIRAVARRVSRERGDGRGLYDAEDLAQEVCVVVFKDRARRLRQFDAKRASLEGYVSVIARTESTQLLKRQFAQKRGGDAQRVELDERDRVDGDTPEAEVSARQMAIELHTHLAESLPPRGQLIYQLLYGDGLGAAEAAQVMKVNAQVVYNWQQRIRNGARAVL